MKILIDFKPQVQQSDIDAYFTQYGCTVVKQYDNFEEVFLVTADAAPPVTDIIESIIDDESQPVQLLAVDTTVGANIQTGTIDMHADRDWWKVASLASPNFDNPTDTYPIHGQNVTVYMMDSGIEQTHPEFEGANIRLLYSFTGDFTDTTGHGTALASIVAGKTCGMTNPTLAVVKIFDKNVQTLQSDMLTAFDAIISDFNTNGQKASVINMSWSISKNGYIESKITKLIESGVYAIASAGNSGTVIGDVTPASMTNVITIGSYGQTFYPSDFSNYSGSATSLTAAPTNGGQLDGWAPGEQIYAAVLGGAYGTVAGTSLAAAIHTASTVYNMSDVVTDDGKIGLEVIDGYGTKYMGEIGFYRRNMIHLDDPKYASSVNLVTTFKTHASDITVPAASEFTVRVGDQICQNFANSLAIEQITADQDLPTGMRIDNGMLVGSIDSITGDWEYFEINLTLTLRDGAGQTPYQSRIWVISKTYDASQQSTDPGVTNPPLNLMLAAGCANPSCTPLGCSACVNCGDAKNPACQCSDLSCA